jgi:Holliday junction resolvase RusA-like endonuclease
MTTLDLPLPPSVNNMFANNPLGGRFRTTAYRRWASDARWSVIAQTPMPRLVAPPYRVEIELPRGMRGDISNRVKAIEDLLVAAGVLEDDRHVVVLLVRRGERAPGTCGVHVATERAP